MLIHFWCVLIGRLRIIDALTVEFMLWSSPLLRRLGAIIALVHHHGCQTSDQICAGSCLPASVQPPSYRL